MKTTKEGITCVFDENNELVAIIYKDHVTHHNLFYSTKIMSMEEIESLVGSNKVKTNV